MVKLKGYWKQVKQAPSDVEHLKREIDLVSRFMAHIQNDQAALGMELDQSYVQQCRMLFEECSKELQELVGDLEAALKGDGAWKQKAAAAKVVFKRDDIKRLRKRWKNAVELLQLAHQCHIKFALLFMSI
jgi:chromosome condensin MukBEF complex kleisin-like MukF subunit